MPVERIQIAAQKILLGRLAESLAQLKLGGRILVLGSARGGAIADWPAALPDRQVTIFAGAREHNPAAVVEEAVARASDCRPDHLLAIGGGSVIDLAKAVAAQNPTPIVAVPTTLGGAEMTRVYGFRRDDGIKDGGAGAACLPASVCYDPQLLESLPFQHLAASGMNALAHAIEARYARRRHWLAIAAADRAGAALPDLLIAARNGRDTALHSRLFEAACLAGFALNGAGMGLHHAICHVLGGLTGLSHGALNAVVLPAAVAANHRLAPDDVARVATGFGVADLPGSIASLVKALDLPPSLAALGVDESVLEAAVPLIGQSHHMTNNPAVLDGGAIRAVLDQAYRGYGH